MTTPPDDSSADLHAVIRALRAERDAALSEKAALAEALATRNSEYGERIQQQSATIDVLKVMSASPGDPQPVFDLIVRRARDVCNGAAAILFEFDGRLVHFRARSGYDIDQIQAEYQGLLPAVPTRDSITCRAVLDNEIIHVRDLDMEPDLLPVIRRMGHKSQLSIPCLRDGNAIGVITLVAMEPGGFSDSQIALLQTFAEQAVIAITSAETYRVLQTRTADLQESLEYQTATSDVLKVIGRSTFDLHPVFETIVITAGRLCGSNHANITIREGDGYRWVAGFSDLPGEAARGRFFPVDRESITGRTVLAKQVVHVADVTADPDFLLTEGVRRAGVRTVLGVPMMRDGVVVGTLNLGRDLVRPFSERQIELVLTFADQAVIAMENARLITEQREALEQQTATAEVLQVINASPGNLEPVFDAMLQRATRLCGTEIGSFWSYNGEAFQVLASTIGDTGRTTQPPPDTALWRIAHGESVVQIADVETELAYRVDAVGQMRTRLAGTRTALGVALRKDETLVGAITTGRTEVRPFTDKQIALLQNFAAQAVIAMENARLLAEQQEALEQQTATAEVLQIINASPGDLAPVFDAILEKAHHLCGAVHGVFGTYNGDYFRAVASRGLPAAVLEKLKHGFHGLENPITRPLFEGARFVQIPDLKEIDHPIPKTVSALGGFRTALFVPLRKDGTLLGHITALRSEVRLFTDKQIALLQNFAAQAVIAMENARLITEQREALEQQTATAEVLQVINANPGNLAPVFDTVLDKALHLCEAPLGGLAIYDGEIFYNVAKRGADPAYADVLYAPIRPGFALARLVRGEEFVQVADITTDDLSDSPRRRAFAEIGARTAIWIALRRDKAVVGMIDIYRKEVRPFTGKQIALLQNFAAQAVIAMENARLLDEIRQRQEELRITFENMGDGVAMFDEAPRLVAWNRKFQDILDLPDGVLAESLTFAEYIRYLAERGEYGEADPEEQIRRLTENADQYRAFERLRPDGRVIEIRHNPVPGGGFVLIYSDITERKRSEAEIRAARDTAEEASRTIEAAYRDLKAAQANLIQAEKMASLGQLTAGIAHEIKNPLNFVNNFSALSTELIDELRDVLAPEPLGETARTEVDDLTALLKGNLEKVVQHGQRADGIVRSMLDHSRGSSGERRIVDLNTLIDEALNLAYHGARAQDQSFNITLERDFGEGIAPIEVNPQDITRVFLNIFSNGFYATTRRARDGGDAGFVPTLKVTTRDDSEAVEIRVRDNGTGIPADIRDKLFQPFFTTKPTGEGTGLGLSITYDIVTQQHGGTIAVESEVGEYSEFTIQLPRYRP